MTIDGKREGGTEQKELRRKGRNSIMGVHIGEGEDGQAISGLALI